MAFEINNIVVAKKSMLEKSEFSVECNISGGAMVSKVLASAIEPSIVSCETLTGTVNYSGELDIKVIVLDEEGQFNSTSSTCPFSSKFEGENIENGQNAHIELKVIDYNIVSINGDNIKLNVMLEQSGFVYGNKDEQTIRCDDEDICFKTDKFNATRFVGASKASFNVTSEISSREKVSKILLVESKALVRNVEAGVNFVTVYGDVISKVLYISENDRFESGYVVDSFKEEVEVEGASRDSSVQAFASVKEDGVLTEIVEDEKGVKITITVPVNLKVCVYDSQELEIINDIYSTTSDLSVTTSSFDMACLCKMDVVEGKIEGNSMIEDDKPRVDKILFNAGNNVVITNSYIENDEITIEGIAKTNVVYLNDEDSSINSVQLDVPFVISDKFEGQTEGIVSVSAIVCDVDVVVKKGRELFYDARVKANVIYCTSQTCGVISGAEKLDSLQERDYAMEVIFAKAGDELWDIAKKAKVHDYQLQSQNPDVAFPLQEDQSLIIFYQKMIENVE